jgi:CubicO group peptidase (beta-lactamase class C family)
MAPLSHVVVVLGTFIVAGRCQDLFLTRQGNKDAIVKQAPAPPPPDPFDSITKLLSGWEFSQEFALSVGNAKYGEVFRYEGGKFTMNTKIPTGSTSKWPSAMMFAGLVNDGTIASLDDPVNKYLSYWTKDTSDKRSLVTFRMLLSFTSGFGDGHPGEQANTRAAREWRLARNMSRRSENLFERLRGEIGEDAALKCNDTTGDIPTCAQSIYENVKLIGTPGKVYSYNSNHLQLAAGVAVAVTGLDIHQVVQKYLLKPYNMTNSLYYGKCPDFGGSLVTTGEDYGRFLKGVLSYKVLSKEITDASEKDYTPFMSDYYTLYGDYGFGHFLMCFDSVYGFTDACREAKCHMDPGAFGFIPIIDRKYGYYVQVVAAEVAPTGTYALSGIPEYLAVAIKPHIDMIMSGHDDPYAHASHQGPLTLGVADVNYCLNCKLNPKECS